MTVHERLVAARNEIDRKGLCTDGRATGSKGEVCAGQALLNASGADLWSHLWTDEAAHVLADCAGLPKASNPCCFRGHIANWNDGYPERVLPTFDKAIAATAPPPPDPKWSEIVEELETTKAVVA